MDEALGAELLCTAGLVAIHDPIKLLNFDDALGLYMETLSMSNSDAASGQRKRSCSRGTCSAQSIADLITRQIENDDPQCENWNFLELCKVVGSIALIQSQSCCLAPLCELCWSFNVTPLSILT